MQVLTHIMREEERECVLLAKPRVFVELHERFGCAIPRIESVGSGGSDTSRGVASRPTAGGCSRTTACRDDVIRA